MTNEEMERAVNGLDAIAAKVRALHEAGAGVGEIRRFLDISYQHAYNVLLRAGAIKKKSEREAPVPAPAPTSDGGEIFMARADASGAVHFDKALMKELGITPGEEIFCRRTPEGLLLIGREAALEQITRMAKVTMPGQASILEALLKVSKLSN